MTSLRRALGVLGGLALAHCGGRANDRTVLDEPPAEPEPVAVDGSRAIAALAEPEVRDSFCGWLGASAANAGGRFGAPLECSEVVERCRDAASDPAYAGSVDSAANLLDVPVDLEGVLGCPASLDEIDACLAELIQLVAMRYPDGPGCGAPVMTAPLGVQDLPALRSCVTVAANCPELLQRVLAAGG